MKDKKLSTWKGSFYTASMVATEIGKRWGDKEVENYNPMINCFTLKTWNQLGYRVKKGEKAIKSVTFIKGDKKNKNGVIEEKTYPRNVNLFYIKQVKMIEEKKQGLIK